MISDKSQDVPHVVYTARGILPQWDPPERQRPFEVSVAEGQQLCLLGDGHSGVRQVWQALVNGRLTQQQVRRHEHLPPRRRLPGDLIAFEHDHRSIWSEHRNVRWALDQVGRTAAVPAEVRLQVSQLFELEGLLDVRLRELSPVHRRLCSLARVFARRPVVALLFNPVADVDVASAHRVMSCVGRACHMLTVSAIWTSDDPVMTSQYAQQVLLFRGGRIVRSGAVSEVLPSAGTGVVELDVWGDIDRLACRLTSEPWVLGVQLTFGDSVTKMIVLVTDVQRALYLLPRLAMASNATPQSCRSVPYTLEVLFRTCGHGGL